MPPRRDSSTPVAETPSVPPSGSRRAGHEHAEDAVHVRVAAVWTLTVIRSTAIAETLSATAMSWRACRHPVAVMAGATAVMTETVALIALCRRRMDVRACWAYVDISFTTAVTILGIMLSAPSIHLGRAEIDYADTVIAALIIGLMINGLRGAMAAMTISGALWILLCATTDGTDWRTAGNATAYYIDTLVAWAITSRFRCVTRDLDRRAHNDVERASRLARQAERLRVSRLLHDRVLQTLEALVRHRAITDASLRAQVAAETTWLRRFVEGDDQDLAGGLADALGRVYERHRRAGLSLVVNDARLRRGAVPELGADRLAALAGAVNEALTNVGKHAGAVAATVHVDVDQCGISVGIADSGRGFDCGAVSSGLGLRECIRARLVEVGGRVRLDSSPGAGTYLELWVPFE